MHSVMSAVAAYRHNTDLSQATQSSTYKMSFVYNLFLYCFY